MIPFIHVPDLPIGPLTLHPFGLLVATGVIIGTWLATRRARQRGLDLEKLNSFITWMLIAGFMGGHMLDEIFYHPQELVKRPWSLFFLWEGLSSFGGFTGALIGIVLWKYFEAVPLLRTPLFTIPRFKRRPQTMPILPFADLILSVFPVAWIFGRSGCSVVHDHLGQRAPAGTPLTVAAGLPDPSKTITIAEWFRADPNGKMLVTSGQEPQAMKVRHALELTFGNQAQFDLGLIEMMFTVVLAALLALTWRRKLTTGSYVAATALAYAPVRLAMDFLRLNASEGNTGDPRYGGFTPGQWACVALFTFGLVMVARVRQIRRTGNDPMALVSLPLLSELERR